MSKQRLVRFLPKWRFRSWKNCVYSGICKGLGIEENVNSPTFTIIQVYEEGEFYIILMYIELVILKKCMKSDTRNIFFGEGVCLIEWSKLIEELIPEEAINIEIDKNLEKGLDYRKITVEGL